MSGIEKVSNPRADFRIMGCIIAFSGILYAKLA
jgi:hypothetical protein